MEIFRNTIRWATLRFRWILILAVLAASVGWFGTQPKDHQEWTAQEKAQLVKSVSEWIRTERARHRPLALPLDPTEITVFEQYFPKEILESVRVRAVDKMPSPDFADAIRHRGHRIFDPSQARGLALDDTVLLLGRNLPPGSPARRSVLFHEIVHVAQYRYLRVDSFIQRYFASLEDVRYRYPDIVFESQAFELQHRFTTSLGRPFSVDDEVRAIVASSATR